MYGTQGVNSSPSLPSLASPSLRSSFWDKWVWGSVPMEYCSIVSQQRYPVTGNHLACCRIFLANLSLIQWMVVTVSNDYVENTCMGTCSVCLYSIAHVQICPRNPSLPGALKVRLLLLTPDIPWPWLPCFAQSLLLWSTALLMISQARSCIRYQTGSCHTP